jgi:hypothetical protein
MTTQSRTATSALWIRPSLQVSNGRLGETPGMRSDPKWRRRTDLRRTVSRRCRRGRWCPSADDAEEGAGRGHQLVAVDGLMTPPPHPVIRHGPAQVSTGSHLVPKRIRTGIPSSHSTSSGRGFRRHQGGEGVGSPRPGRDGSRVRLLLPAKPRHLLCRQADHPADRLQHSIRTDEGLHPRQGPLGLHSGRLVGEEAQLSPVSRQIRRIEPKPDDAARSASVRPPMPASASGHDPPAPPR